MSEQSELIPCKNYNYNCDFTNNIGKLTNKMNIEADVFKEEIPPLIPLGTT